jgi:hypothetical protein
MQMSRALLAAMIAVSPAAAFAQSNSYPSGTDCSKLPEAERAACEQQMNTMQDQGNVTKPNNASGDGADPSDPNTDTNSSNMQPDANGATNSGQTN